MSVTAAIRPAALRGARRTLWTRFVEVTGTRPISRALVAAGLGATLLATVMVVALHLLPRSGGVNPVYGMLSDYALQPDAWVWDLALVITGLGSTALWAVLVRHHVLRGFLPMAAMAAWCLGLLGVAAFAKDRVETDQTLHGGIHLWITAAVCAALPLVGLLLGVRHRRHAHWRRYARPALALALGNIPCLVPFVVAFFLNVLTRSEQYSGPATGIVERVMGGLDIVSLVLLAVWAYAAAHDRRAVLLAKRSRSAAAS